MKFMFVRFVKALLQAFRVLRRKRARRYGRQRFLPYLPRRRPRSPQRHSGRSSSPISPPTALHGTKSPAPYEETRGNDCARRRETRSQVRAEKGRGRKIQRREAGRVGTGRLRSGCGREKSAASFQKSTERKRPRRDRPSGARRHAKSPAVFSAELFFYSS